jgi:hypothetical protein
VNHRNQPEDRHDNAAYAQVKNKLVAIADTISSQGEQFLHEISRRFVKCLASVLEIVVQKVEDVILGALIKLPWVQVGQSEE